MPSTGPSSHRLTCFTDDFEDDVICLKEVQRATQELEVRFGVGISVVSLFLITYGPRLAKKAIRGTLAAFYSATAIQLSGMIIYSG